MTTFLSTSTLQASNGRLIGHFRLFLTKNVI